MRIDCIEVLFKGWRYLSAMLFIYARVLHAAVPGFLFVCVSQNLLPPSFRADFAPKDASRYCYMLPFSVVDALFMTVVRLRVPPLYLFTEL